MITPDPIFSYLVVGRSLFTIADQINKKLSASHNDRKLLYVWGGDGLELDKFFNSDYSKKLIITNNVVKCLPEQQKHIHTVNPVFYGMYFFNFPDSSVKIEKDFNCFVNRYDIFRQSWIYQLIRHELFDRGFISFNGEMNNNRVPSQEFVGLSPSQGFELGFQKYNSIFEKEHNIIKNQIPYKNFNDTGDLTNVVLASKFSIVLETFFHDNKIITYSEKTFRCLQLPRPWVLFSSQFAIDNLRTLGFDVLDDLVDHSYDCIADTVQRQLAIIDQCKLLVNQPLNLQRTQQAADQNKSLLESMKKNWLINIQTDFDIAYEKLLTL